MQSLMKSGLHVFYATWKCSSNDACCPLYVFVDIMAASTVSTPTLHILSSCCIICTLSFNICDIYLSAYLMYLIWMKNGKTWFSSVCFIKLKLGKSKRLTQFLEQITWKRDSKNTYSWRSFISSRSPGTQTKWN